MLASTKPGYVYMLQARDIALPSCKIGMTARTPKEHCAELNKGATGDLLWSIFDTLNVSDCQALAWNQQRTAGCGTSDNPAGSSSN